MGCGGSKNEKIQENVDTSDYMPERKVVLIGDSSVGKSAIIHQFVANAFGKQQPTIGVKNQYKIVDVPGSVQDGKQKQIKLDIWDTAGEAAQQQMNQNFLHGAHAVIIVYSIDMPTTFKSVSNYFESVERVCPANTIKVLVGNKCDLDNNRRVKMQDLSDKAEEHGDDLHFETSAFPEYKGTIEAMFNAIIKKLADLPLDQSKRNIKLTR